MTSKQPLQVLIVEDSENDALLLEIELHRAGYQAVCHRVDSAATMKAALERRQWDLIVADYVLPHFNGLAALALVKESEIDVPFVIVSGHITDATAVSAMKAGAHDYVMKDNLARLGPAVERELRDAEVRRHRRHSEEKLNTEYTFRQAIENSVPAGISVVDLEGRQTYVNPAFCAMVCWSEAELVGARPPFAYWPEEEISAITEALGKASQGHSPPGGVELRFGRRTGERFDVLLQVTPLRDNFGNVTGWVSSASDITARKRAEVRLAAEHAITRILANAQSVEEAAPGIVQVLLDGLEVDVGALWMVDLKREVLHPLIMNLRSLRPAWKSFLQERRRLSLKHGDDLPGRVWHERRPVWLADLIEEGNLQRREAAAKAGLKSGFAFPVQSGKDFFGVLEFFTVRRLAHDPTLGNMMSAIASEIGQFIKRRTAEEDLRRAHDELEMRVQQRTVDLKSANAKLQASISERKRLEHELLEITEKERRRLALDLHDDLGQKLSGIALMTKGLELKLTKRRVGESRDAGRIHELVQEAISHTRDLAHDLAKLDLKENDLPGALNNLAAHAKRLFEISCKFKADEAIPPLELNVASQLYKIAQEAVTNAIKHGKARNVGISLANGSDRIVLTIHNDGLPFPDLKSQSTGMGLRIMNYRASLIGASLEVKGTGAHGTRVTCSMPFEAKH
jgi:PAS domain S-box-containing protein